MCARPRAPRCEYANRCSTVVIARRRDAEMKVSLRLRLCQSVGESLSGVSECLRLDRAPSDQTCTPRTSDRVINLEINVSDLEIHASTWATLVTLL